MCMCVHAGPRKEPPCQLEFNAAKHKQIMRVKVQADLMTRHHRKTEGQFSGTDIHCAPDARLDPASTNQEWTEEICTYTALLACPLALLPPCLLPSSSLSRPVFFSVLIMH